MHPGPRSRPPVTATLPESPPETITLGDRLQHTDVGEHDSGPARGREPGRWRPEQVPEPPGSGSLLAAFILPRPPRNLSVSCRCDSGSLSSLPPRRLWSHTGPGLESCSGGERTALFRGHELTKEAALALTVWRPAHGLGERLDLSPATGNGADRSLSSEPGPTRQPQLRPPLRTGTGFSDAQWKGSSRRNPRPEPWGRPALTMPPRRRGQT